MLTGLVLLYVGAVLFLNGLWLSGRIEDREIVLINVATGTISLFVAGYLAFGPGADDASIAAAAMTLLFAITYFWVAFNRVNGADGRGLGWFSLFVAITVLPVAVRGLVAVETPGDLWLAGNWLIWAALWFLYFVVLALGRPVGVLTARATLLSGIFTGWLPGMAILNGVL